MTEQVMEACNARFDLVRLWEAFDPEATLRERADEIRAVATAGRPAIDADLFDRLPRLEVVANYGVGYDAVDVAAAAARGIMVTNTPDVLTEDVADLAVALFLMTVRELPQAERHLRSGAWVERPFRLAPTRVHGRRVGIVGLGRIGEAIAHRLKPFGVEIYYHNRRAKDVPFHYCATVSDLASRVDTLVVATPGGSETQHLIDEQVLRLLGDRGILINVARGSVVDEDALIKALSSGAILAAGLDVFEDEPLVPEALLALPNAVLLPHVGSASVDTRRDMGQLVVENLIRWFENGAVVTPVPETPPSSARTTA